MELRAAIGYRRMREPLTFWRSTSGFEVDFLIGTRCAVEVKAATKVSERDARGLKALQEEKAVRRHCLVSQDRVERKVGGIEYLHWETFLGKLWAGTI